MKIIPQNTEKYLTFSVKVLLAEWTHDQGKTHKKFYQIKFIDSMAFLPEGLDNKLAKSLKDEDFVHTKMMADRFGDDPSFFQMLRKKGAYMYEYMTCLARYYEKSLPPKEAFMSRLRYGMRTYVELTEIERLGDPEEKDDHVAHIGFDAYYNEAVKLWNLFKCQTLMDFHDIYLESDVMLLTDIFEKYRKTTDQFFRLDPLHYVSLPGVAWDSMLKHTGKTFRIITDYDMAEMFERGKLGGISMVRKRLPKLTIFT
jgi:hypothetical protein